MPDSTPIIAPVQTEDYKLKLLEEKITGTEQLLHSEIHNIEKAIELAHADLVRLPTDIDKATNGLKELHNEKFKGIDQRFVDNDKALQAALASQKEAVIKSEIGFTKQIDAIQRQIDDLKQIASRNEGSTSGKKDFWGYVIAAIMALIAIVTLFSKINK